MEFFTPDGPAADREAHLETQPLLRYWFQVIYFLWAKVKLGFFQVCMRLSPQAAVEMGGCGHPVFSHPAPRYTAVTLVQTVR